LNVHKHPVAAARYKMEASELFLSKFVKPINRPSAYLKAETDGVVVLDQSVFARKKSKLRRRPRKKLSRSAIKQLGLYALPHDTIRYKDAVKLHAIWCTYMEKLIEKAGCAYNVKDMRYNTLVGVLLKADFHGAKVSVVRSKQSSVIGVKGIVILDTKGTFKIVSKDNKIRTIPKNDSQFEVYTTESVISIFGKFLTYRPAERSTRKMKIFSTPDL
uniref:Ribonuclease P protein subunit p29 n=2 Tax=Anopheles atroparvus TaxID=41427 RepID=A0A182J9W7_ANOAO